MMLGVALEVGITDRVSRRSNEHDLGSYQCQSKSKGKPTKFHSKGSGVSKRARTEESNTVRSCTSHTDSNSGQGRGGRARGSDLDFHGVKRNFC